jgi:NTE family protein
VCLRWAINHEDALSVEHAITLMIAWQLMYESERISNDIQVHLVPTLCPLAASPFDFSLSRELIECAAQSTKKWIDEDGLTRRSLPQELAPHRH